MDLNRKLWSSVLCYQKSSTFTEVCERFSIDHQNEKRNLVSTWVTRGHEVTFAH